MNAENTIQFLIDQYDKDMTDGQLDFWIEALSEYTPETLKRASMSVVKSSKWLPKLAEFIQICEHEKFNDPSYNISIWDSSMELLGKNLRGEITDQQLETDASWQWYKRQSPGVDMDEYAELRTKSDVEVAEWMQA